ncbi:hypothetical protein AYI68_g3941 [Smittium mucronatum]|uniref:Uncharacterized protein n=1 Tax=Smittium mucronatum TaxID=133383 RepID=A0A1R0GYF6_9FUNG|nr:hypothetical protein AYI68_g3941 [Smittium mucronatum]
MYQLVQRQKIARPELSGLQMVKLKKNLRFPTLENYRADSSKGMQGTSHNDISDSNLEISDMLPGPYDRHIIPNPLATSYIDHSRSEKAGKQWSLQTSAGT